ncbi:McrB family protein [Companilactobacillus mishanensis]|uniref:McrB family protein n=1 Tax=Companilactobacillus mishanensis TaxID=2486008 RepID=UPI0012956515|nr:AAA family ATPase [Companilactobacillus mishanensis]MQS89569.1 hypothetical protein [Companilactobacillus mishanensis]
MTKSGKDNETSKFQVLCKFSDDVLDVSISSKNVFLKLKPISTTPVSFEEKNIKYPNISYTVDSDLHFDEENSDSMVDQIIKFYKDKLFLSEFVLEYQGTQVVVHSVSNTKIIRKNKYFSESSIYDAVPIVGTNIYKGKITGFVKYLKSKNSRFKLDNWSNNDKDFPRQIIFDNGTEYLLFQGITGQTYDEKGYHFEVANELNEIPISYEKFSEYFYSDVNDSSDENIKEFAFLLHDTHAENKFIEHFKTETEKEGLYYNPADLINFHTAMMSQGMVILSGLSGTGKSQLVNSYVKALGVEDNFCFVPVRSSWTDDSDLLGFFDSTKNRFKPGTSHLVDTLIDAVNNPNELFVVLFDEMNLAKVEHYFSQFLSVLEIKDDSMKQINLYNAKAEDEDPNYPARISVGNNVLFVGTENTDESTFNLSDKVLDRSNIINLHVKPFYEGTPNENKLLKDDDYTNVTSFDDYTSFKNAQILQDRELTQDELKMFWVMHKSINFADPNVGIGWRIINQINDYLTKLPDDSQFSRQNALDAQIVQRVLSKVRGSEEQMTDLLSSDGIEKLLKEVQSSGSENSSEDDYFKKAEDDAPLQRAIPIESIIQHYCEGDFSDEFLETQAVLDEKRRNLAHYGFTM